MADLRAFVASLGDWRNADRGLARSLAAAIRDAVVDGRLPVGTTLPAERTLAAALELSRGTVVAGLALLREDGWLRTRHGGGSVVLLPEHIVERTTPLSLDRWGDGRFLDMTVSVSSAPHHAYRRALERAAERLPPLLVDSGLPTSGLPVLRELLAERYTARGLPTRPEQILITSGARSALALVLERFHDRRRSVVVENPTFHGALALVRRRRARLVGVPVTGDGWDVDRLTAAMRAPDTGLAYLTPDFHNPTGALMGERDRARLLSLTRAGAVMLVTDETMRDLDLRPSPTPPSHLGGPGTLIIGSTAKVLWSGLRVGWIRAGSAGWVRELLLNPLQAQFSPPPLEQLIAHELLLDLERILDERRARLRAQRDRLADLLAGTDAWTYTVPPGGLTLWLRLRHVFAENLARRAGTHGLTLATGPYFSADRGLSRHLRLPFTASPELLDKAVAVLRTAHAELRGHPDDPVRTAGAASSGLRTGTARPAVMSIGPGSAGGRRTVRRSR
ncbi:PLP-dependent aminotransferase family protein [Rhizohabitans arisaemae]|uniref:aminotransferase-like domain-containing protein n=1 Tax=Rhizohabitans arisaemae TaxID=2720610 RepID=UPI0024B27FFB|nr:PLP-dependent aminotransferase family protein [Rhizohabitans arisaemae]